VLPELAVRDGKAEPDLVAALSDKSSLKRAAAAAALCRANAPDVMPRVRKLLADRDPKVRLRLGLALMGMRDKEAVGVLIGMLDEVPFHDADAIMNVLERLAGESMPAVVYGPDAASHRKYRAAWETWWKEQQAKLEPARLEQALNSRGHTLIVLLDKNRIADLDATNKVRWQIEGVDRPLDAQLLPGEERVLTAEYQSHRVSERNIKGEIVWQKRIPMPIMAQRLPNGHTFVATQNQLLEYDKDGREVFSYGRPDGGDFMRATKLRNGDIACIVQQLGMPRFMLLSPAGGSIKEVKSWGVQVRTSGGRLDVLPNGHVLIPEMDNNRVVEYDEEGQMVWELPIDQPIAAVRQPNGNTIITLMRENRAVEVDRRGKEVWQYKTDTRVTRALRH
jgi:hypothetical protein